MRANGYISNRPAVYSRDELRALGDALRPHPYALIASDDMYEHINLSVTSSSTSATHAPICTIAPSFSTAFQKPIRKD